MTYVIFTLAVIVVNVLPAFAPPTWTLIVFFLNYYHLNIFLVVILAVFAAASGRYLLYFYVKKFARAIFNEWEQDNLAYLGDRIGKKAWSNFVFVFFYAITPLSTTALFVAAAVANIRKSVLFAGFICGRIVSYSFLAFTSTLVVKELDEIIQGSFTWQAVLTSIAGLGILLFLTFLDWRELLEHKKCRLNFKIWRWYR